MHASPFGVDAAVDFVPRPSALAAKGSNLIFVHNNLAIVGSGAISGQRSDHFVNRDGAIREGAPTLRRLVAPLALSHHELELLHVEGVLGTVTGHFDWNAFVRAIVLHETQAIERFLALILGHCSRRVVGDRKLSTISSIRLRLAETSQMLALTREMADGDLCPAATREISLLISRAVDSLIKTAGARSMLVNGLVEMQVIFALFNNIYLCDYHD